MARGPAGKEGSGVKKGTWTAEEDRKLVAYVTKYGCWNWRQIPKFAGLARCGKSCRLRWLNYLRPDVKRGDFTQQEDHTIIKLHQNLGNRWSKIAAHLPGRSDNEIKNHWHTNLKKKHYSSQQIDQCMQNTHTTTSEESDASQASSSSSNNNNNNSNSQISNSSSSMCSNSNLVVEDYYYNNYDDEELLGFESALFIEPTTHNFWTHPYMLDDDISYHYSNQTPQDFASLTHPQLWPHNLDHFDQYSAFF